jgi:ABC-2 type transport system ATP-binding protein
MSALLEATDLRKTYPRGAEAVRGVSLSVPRGEVFAFLGPNGAGKSTTLRMICGLCRPTSGSSEIDSLDLERNRNAYMRRLGLVSQHFNVDDDLTVYENMIVHAGLHGLRGSEVKARVLKLLSFAELADCRDRMTGALSGGMKRKLQIVRSLVHEPEILFLDEPTAGLDPLSRERIWNLLLELNASGMTIFFSTHYIDEAERYAQRVSIMHRGRIIKTGSPCRLIEEAGSWCRESFGAGRTHREHFSSREEAEVGAPLDGYSMLTIRRTQLEDVFIKLSGSTLQEGDAREEAP